MPSRSRTSTVVSPTTNKNYGVPFDRRFSDCYALLCPCRTPSLRSYRCRHLDLHVRQHDGRRRSESTDNDVPQVPGQASTTLLPPREAPRDCFALASRLLRPTKGLPPAPSAVDSCSKMATVQRGAALFRDQAPITSLRGPGDPVSQGSVS